LGVHCGASVDTGWTCGELILLLPVSSNMYKFIFATHKPDRVASMIEREPRNLLWTGWRIAFSKTSHSAMLFKGKFD
jgi:ribosomal protein L24E